ncbi:MAG: sulfite exporter TauE/SafE family protein [Methylococcaceae bacterium]|nr:MAG: sulfite exporter TauE/SafE family protein [Methylococcaceae bacterium]
MYEVILIYLAVGCLAGLLSGLFGVGGGIVIVPLLATAFEKATLVTEDLVMVMAVATSLASIVATSLSSVVAHQRRGAVVWSWVWRLAPGILLGAGAGAVLAEGLPGRALKLAFALFLLYVAARLLFPARPSAAGAKHSAVVNAGAGFGIGLLSAIIGIGGGTLTVPYLVKRRLIMTQAVASSSACGLPIALAGALTYGYLGWNRPDLPPLSWGYIYLPALAGVALCSSLCAPLGVRLAHWLPGVALKRWFALLLLLVSGRLLYQSWPW